ncbi:MAG: Tfp pilus assembly protein FimT/FimU [Cyanobacteriota bacterium]
MTLKAVPGPHRTEGYTLTELLICIALVGLLGGMSTLGFLNQMRSEKANAIAVEIAGWLANVHRAALRGRRCEISFDTSGAILQPGSPLAVASEPSSSQLPIANSCLSYTPLQIGSVEPSTGFRLSSNDASFAFTPRGTITGTNTPTVVIGITLTEGGLPHCVEIDGMLGLVSVGHLVNNQCEAPA